MCGLGILRTDEEEEDGFDELPDLESVREIARVYDFVEVCGGADIIAKRLRNINCMILVVDLS